MMVREWGTVFVCFLLFAFGGKAVARPSLRQGVSEAADSIDEAHIRYLIALANATNPGAPFAASIVDRSTNTVLCTGVNSNTENGNPTYHGEIVAINNCSTLHGWNRTAARNYTLYTTAESCPMCQGGTYAHTKMICSRGRFFVCFLARAFGEFLSDLWKLISLLFLRCFSSATTNKSLALFSLVSAIEFARIGRMVYGTSIPFLEQAGWTQIDIRATEIDNRTLFNSCEVVGGVLEDECNTLFVRGAPADWQGHHHDHHLHDHALL